MVEGQTIHRRLNNHRRLRQEKEEEARFLQLLKPVLEGVEVDAQCSQKHKAGCNSKRAIETHPNDAHLFQWKTDAVRGTRASGTPAEEHATVCSLVI